MHKWTNGELQQSILLHYYTINHNCLFIHQMHRHILPAMGTIIFTFISCQGFIKRQIISTLLLWWISLNHIICGLDKTILPLPPEQIENLEGSCTQHGTICHTHHRLPSSCVAQPSGIFRIHLHLVFLVGLGSTGSWGCSAGCWGFCRWSMGSWGDQWAPGGDQRAPGGYQGAPEGDQHWKTKLGLLCHLGSHMCLGFLQWYLEHKFITMPINTTLVG